MTSPDPHPLGKAQRIRSASAALFAIGITSLALRFISIAVVAAHFGAGLDTDVLFLGQLLPVMLGFHSRSVLHLSLVPKFVATRNHRGQGEAWALASSFANLALASLAIVAIGYAAAAPLAVHVLPGLAGEGAARFVRVTRIVSPVIVLFPAFALGEALLYSYRRYTTAALATLLPSLGLILGVVTLGPTHGIDGASWGLVSGYALQALVVLPQLAPYHRHFRLGVDWRSPALREVLRQVTPTAAFSLAVVGGFAVAAVLASHLGPGRVAAFRYGTSVLAVLPTLVQGSLVSPLYPRMAALAADGDTARLRQLVVSFIRIASVVLMPITALVIVLREPMVGALFVRGRFTAADAQLTSQVVLGFAPWIAAIVLNQVPTYLAMSLGEARKIAALVLGLLLPMTAVGFVLSRLYDVGGIALAFSLNSWVSLPPAAGAAWAHRTPRDRRGRTRELPSAPRRDHDGVAGDAARALVVRVPGEPRGGARDRLDEPRPARADRAPRRARYRPLRPDRAALPGTGDREPGGLAAPGA
ncbi:MAG: oligosaccharide flippase family protein, partial [Deltaproteobacteria bacterium]|nr:oligosaccharide flippase family protein [Deltaproteobacteria bacterium]